MLYKNIITYQTYLIILQKLKYINYYFNLLILVILLYIYV